MKRFANYRDARSVLLLAAVIWIWTAPAVARSAETTLQRAKDRDGNTPQPIVAVDNVCAWPNLTLLPDGAVVATIFNQPSHGSVAGDVDCWASTDGGWSWQKRARRRLTSRTRIA